MKSQRYLKQLNIESKHATSSEQQLTFLDEIYFAHLKTFPFHNFELRTISRQHPVKRHSLSFFTDWEQGVNGGFCFQSAQLLYQVLVDVGFDVTRHLARVVGNLGVNSKELLALPATHVFLVVKIDNQNYLLDPGLGSHAPAHPLPFEDKLRDIQQGHRQFRFYQAGDIYILERKLGGKWVALSQTDLVEATERDLQFSLLKLARFPLPLGIRDTKLIAGILTDTGSKNLFWDENSNEFIYSIEHEGQLTKRTIADAFEICVLLNTEFKIRHISTLDIEDYRQRQSLPKPKERWEVGLPLDRTEFREMSRNFKF